MKGVTILIVVLVILVAAYFLIETPAAEGYGTLVMKITDKPPDENVTAVNVTISSIEIHRSASTTGNATNSTNVSAGWFTFSNQTQTFDLLQIQNITALLGQQQLEAGHYTQIRLMVNSVTVVDNGQVMEATVPSGSIKLVRAFWIEANTTTTLVLDFEAHDFVVKTGSGKYNVVPTAIKVMEE